MQKKLESNLVCRIWKNLPKSRKKQFFFLFILTLLASIAEVISIGTVIPFLSVITDPEIVYYNKYISDYLVFLNINNPNELIWPITFIFCILVIFSGVVRLLLLKYSNNIAFLTGADLSFFIYEKTLHQDYAVHLQRNTSEVINGIFSKTNLVIFGALMPILVIMSAVLMFIAIFGLLLLVDPFISFASCISFGFVYIVVARKTKATKINNSKIISKNSTQILKSLQEALGGIRDVLIDGSQNVYTNIYRGADLRLRKSQANNQIVSQSPRFIIDSIGMILIALFAVFLFQFYDSKFNPIPILGLLAIGAQRLLPLMQQIYISFSAIQGNLHSIQDALDLLEQPVSYYYKNQNIRKLKFSDKITLSNISFKYQELSKNVIDNISLTIKKGERLGIIGSTGSGKSTLVDILMALLTPSEGNILIDEKTLTRENFKSWQKNIAHVPQSIFLSDESIAENIAFGIDKEKINFVRLKKAITAAQLDEVIEKLPYGLDTFVGERGVRLSGGQRQRIGIARALYKGANLIIFDEATSSLDTLTESKIISEIEKMNSDLTIIMIAHRVSTLKKCTRIIEISDGKIKRSGSFKKIVTN